ncbi:hypothetical protein [Spirosoma terrae]|uniref:Uncharacterized protein n=1 Tax=Spirosoma terrae TaxID=1968276 RepID=A0A6L9LHG5_9BACT|nr:hypothetical protein [Spirosoma terrae]NDU99217.1 hypothetical protein [Spirosoma terrae]
MKEYPFHELDYIVREDGARLIRAYVQNPDEPSMNLLRNRIQPAARNSVVPYFWDRIDEIAQSQEPVPELIRRVFNLCFDCAFWDIKLTWYDTPDERRSLVKKNHNVPLSLCLQAIETTEEWKPYIDQFRMEYRLFIDRLHENLDGYQDTSINKPSALAVVEEHRSELRPIVVQRNTFQQGVARTRTYEMGVDKLYDFLVEGNFIVAADSSKVDFRGLFYGEFHRKIDWIGTNQQLRYFVDSLINLKFIQKAEKWQRASDCFTNKGEVILPHQLKDTSDPPRMSSSFKLINRVILELYNILYPNKNSA